LGHPILFQRASEIEKLVANNDKWKDVLDHMLFHLATPLCTRSLTPATNGERERPTQILVIGDSHAYSFYAAARGFAGNITATSSDDENGKSKYCGWTNYLACPMASPTAYGLTNNKSVTGAASKFRDCIRQVGNVDYVAVIMGEVDLRFLAYHRGRKKGVSVLEQIEQSKQNLFKFVEGSILSQGFKINQVLVLGAAMKCPHSQITPMTQDLRLDSDTSHAALRYNHALEVECEARGCHFANPVDDVFNYVRGEVDPFFWSTPLDFHCSSMRVFYFWHRAIQRATRENWCRPSSYES